MDTPEYVGPSLSFGTIAGVFLVCHAPAVPTQHDWYALLARLTACEARAFLISTRGGEPLPAQRNALLDTLAGRAPRLGVLSASSSPGWAHAGLCFVLRLESRVLRFADVAGAARFLACPERTEQLAQARRRGHALVVQARRRSWALAS